MHDKAHQHRPEQVEFALAPSPPWDRTKNVVQATFAELEHDTKKRRPRREMCLEKMDKLVTWERLEERIELWGANCYSRRGS